MGAGAAGLAGPALAEMGKKVLVVDFDPQYNLTTSFGVLPTQAPYNIFPSQDCPKRE